MKIAFRITQTLLLDIQRDLSRPHVIAAERIGFLSCGVGSTDKSVILVAQRYFPVADGDYLPDPRAGAVIGRTALRKALEIAYRYPVGMFHVHRHEHSGKPWFSGLDLRENSKFVPDFWHVRPRMPHGAIVLSHDRAAGLCWYPGRQKPMRIHNFWAVGGRTVKL